MTKKAQTAIVLCCVAVICIASTFLICYFCFPHFFSYDNENVIQPSTQVNETAESVTTRNLVHSPVKITGTSTSAPNSADGVDLIFYWENTGTKSIKYIYVYATPYNRVGDIEASDIGGKTTAKCRLVGPCDSGDGGRAVFENVWYNSVISTAKIDKIEIEYMDGTFETYERMGI